MATDLQGELTCPICMELFKRPLRLPCGHSYCRNCLQVFISQQSQKDIVTGQHKPVKCPECRFMLDVTSEGADTFPVDFKLSKLVEVYMRMEDMENRNEPKKAKTEDDGSNGDDEDECNPELLGACGYTPIPHDPAKPEVPGAAVMSKVEAADDVKCSEIDERTRKKVVYGEDSETDSEKEQSDDSSNRSGPRRRKRKNKVIRFFASLLSLSSSDGEYDLREASSSSSDIDTSRPVREVIPASAKEVPKRRNRWGFFTSSSSESEQNMASSSDDEQTNGPPPRRKPNKKSSGVLSSLQRRFKSSSDDEMLK